MSEAEHTVVAGILQSPSRIADVSSLELDFFKDACARGLFGYAIGYFEKRGRKNSLDFALTRSLLERSKSGSAKRLLKQLGEYESYDAISDAEFRDACMSLVVEHQRAMIKQHGVRAVNAILKGDWKKAQRAMRSGLIAAEDVSGTGERPVNLRGNDGKRLEKAALSKDKATTIKRYYCGFEEVHNRISFAPGELTIVAGYTNDGKTQLSKCIAYNVNQKGATGLYVALEMSAREMQVLFLAQHAWTIDEERVGVDYRSILDGRPSRRDRVLYERALEDYEIEKTGSDEASGRDLHIWAPNRRISWENLQDRVRSLREEGGLDFVVVDYLELVQPSRDLGQYRLNVKEMVEAGKALAREEDIWMIMNHQISRAGRDAAEKRKPHPFYLLRDLGESSGVERAADHVLWIYSCEEYKESREAQVGIAKARKGDTHINGFRVFADFSKSLIFEKEDD